jgi:hypothetical protein
MRPIDIDGHADAPMILLVGQDSATFSLIRASVFDVRFDAEVSKEMYLS